MDTIFAQSSAKGKSGVAVFRISGPRALEILKHLTSINNIKPRFCYLKKLTYADIVIDNAMVIYFNSPNSFTGEDVVEIHTHGSIAVINILTEAIFDTGIARMASPGEFSERAFMNGKMDLTSAEGLADLIESETKMQHKQAIRQMQGELQLLYESWRNELLKIISLLEAYIDFPDEDIPEKIIIDTTNYVSLMIAKFESHLNDKRRGERLRGGLRLTIIGAPNVGKSSLLNFLARREVAIVSNIAGTTRDIIETHIDIGGYPIILSDTAGIREFTEDAIEKEGIKRALDLATYSDIKILMFESCNTIDTRLESMIDEDTIVVINKVDIYAPCDIPHNDYVQISVKQNIGLNDLLRKIEKKASEISMPSDTPSITRIRHRNHIEHALFFLKRFDIKNDLILATEDIRMTMRALESITGRIGVEEVLGEIFSNFCIGK